MVPFINPSMCQTLDGLVEPQSDSTVPALKREKGVVFEIFSIQIQNSLDQSTDKFSPGRLLEICFLYCYIQYGRPFINEVTDPAHSYTEKVFHFGANGPKKHEL